MGWGVCVCVHGLAIKFFVFVLFFAITNMYMYTQQILVAWEFIPCLKVLGLELKKITINFCRDNRQFIRQRLLPRERKRERK